MGSGPRGPLFTGRPLSRPWRRGSVLATALEWKRPNMCRPGSFPWSKGGSGGGRTKPAHGKDDLGGPRGVFDVDVLSQSRLRGLFVGLCASFPRVGCFWRGRLMGLLGRMCPKRRRLKPRWPGYLEETVRCPGVFGVFPLCFQRASVRCCMLPGLIASVLDTWRAQCAVPAPERGCLRSKASWGGALEGAWALSWMRGCAANAGSRPIRGSGPHHQGRSRP